MSDLIKGPPRPIAFVLTIRGVIAARSQQEAQMRVVGNTTFGLDVVANGIIQHVHCEAEEASQETRDEIGAMFATPKGGPPSPATNLHLDENKKGRSSDRMGASDGSDTTTGDSKDN